MVVLDGVCEFYIGKNVCVFMVCISILVMRFLVYEYGVDLVYGEEFVDKCFMYCRWILNKEFGSVDFIDVKGMLIFCMVLEECECVVF